MAQNSFFSNILDSIRNLAAPKADKQRAAEAFAGIKRKAGPLEALFGDPVKTLGKGAAGCRIVSRGGVITGGLDDVVIGTLWAAPNQGHTKGCPVFAMVETGKTFAYLAIRADREGGARANSGMQTVDQLTGEATSEVFTAPDGIKEIRLKPNAASFGAVGYAKAVADVYTWLLQGDGTRKNLVFVAQLMGDHHDTAGEVRIQKVSGWVILEVPAVQAGLGKLSSLGSPKGAPKPKLEKAGDAANAGLPADSEAAAAAKAAFAAIADGDEL